MVRVIKSPKNLSNIAIIEFNPKAKIELDAIICQQL